MQISVWKNSILSNTIFSWVKGQFSKQQESFLVVKKKMIAKYGWVKQIKCAKNVRDIKMDWNFNHKTISIKKIIL